jgi:hypothetical protein
MQIKLKKSIVLFELLVSIVVISIITISTMTFSFNLYKQNDKNLQLNILKIDLESTKIFLEENNFSDIKYENNRLFYNTNILLDGVTKFEKIYQNNIYTINICLKNKYLVCKEWKIKYE